MSDPRQTSDAPASVQRMLVIGLVVFLVLLAGIAVLTWALGDTSLPMEYEGFD